MKKKSIVLNEIDYAERRLDEKNFVDGEAFTLKILAKYYHYHLGYRKKKVVESLKAFMEYAGNSYIENKTFWDNMIEDIVGNVSKYPLFCIDGVWITDAELKKISEIGDRKAEQVAFSYLCIAKFNNAKNPNADSWVGMEYKDLFDLANYKCGQKERVRIISLLIDLGLIELAKKNTNLSCKVMFIDDASEKKLLVSDFRCLGYEYLRYCGENFIRCSDCGILTNGNKNGTKRYCSRCSGTERMVVKDIICIDCGELFSVSSKDNNSCRCSICQEEYRREYLRNAKRKQREREMSTGQIKYENK